MHRNTYVRDIKGIELYEHDFVLYQVQRCSSSQSTWGAFTNKYHGLFQIRGQIIFDQGRFLIEADENEYNDLKKPRGSEKFSQQVWFQRQELSSASQVKKIGAGNSKMPTTRFNILTGVSSNGRTVDSGSIN